jgi:TRAP-type C4-dicarboxylate transport system substrate-binding protein
MNRILITLLALGSVGIADAATLKVATVAPEGSQWMDAMRSGAKEIKERTDGRVEIKLYGGGVMGNDAKVLGKMRIGALQGGAFTPSALGSIYPDLNLYGLPLIFNSEEEAAYVRQSLDAKLMAGLEDAGLVNFGFAAGGFAIIMSNTPVTSLEDLKGKRVWVPEGDTISYEAMRTLSLAPMTLPLTDVLTGLQTGLIDIVGISPIGALVLQWHTKIKYITELPMVYTLGFMVIQKKAFDKLAANDQQVVREVLNDMYKDFDRTNLVDNRGARDALLNAGIESVAFDDSELARIRAELDDTIRTLGEDGRFSLELYEEMLALVEDYRRDNGQVAAQ